MNVERTIHGRPHGNAANTTRRLRLVQVDHHFVPTRAGSDNDLQIVYSIKGLSGETVKLRVTCDHHDPKLIFERDLTDEEKQDGRKKLIKWNGVPTCTSGPLENSLPSPAHGDLTVSLFHDEVQSKGIATRVLYREIKFESITWAEIYQSVTGLATNQFSDATTIADKRLWIQYKLNELGYLAGPLTNPPDLNSTLRALFRYTQSHPDLAKVIDFKTLESPPGTCSWGWRAPWEAKFGTLDNLCSGGTTPDGIDLISRLAGNERPRPDVVEDPGVFLDRDATSRVIIDHDIYYINKDFPTLNANADYDREFLNRFCWPIKARVLLVGRDDADATKPGVDSPEAVGPATCDWVAFDPPENLEMVPVPSSAQLPIQTRARAFITETHKKIAAQFGDEAHALDNCPQSAGGERPSDASDMSAYFEPIVPAPADRTFIGCAVIQFKGSYIGGDNYIIQGRLSLDGYPNSDAIKKEHLKLKGLANSFGDPMPLDPPEPLYAQTGMLTNWRRHHVLRELRWDTMAYPEINWLPIIDNFRAAHIILVPPSDGPIHVGDLLPAADLLNMARTLVADPKAEEPNKSEFQLRTGQAKFSRGGVYPVPLLSMEDFEKSSLNKTAVSTSPTERFANYKGYLLGTNNRWPSYDRVFPLVGLLRQSLNSMNSGPGLVILRVNFIPDPDFSTLLPPDVYRKTASEQAAIEFLRGIAVGMEYGVVFLDRVNTARYKESYFVTHEIAHCLFGSHAFQESSFPDHDRNDKNCMMYYNTNNGGIDFGWAVKDAPEKLTVKLLVQYDETQKDDCGKPSSEWGAGTRTNDGKWRGYIFSGSVEEIQKTLRKSKVTPATWLPDGRSVKIQLVTPGAVSPKLSVRYPYEVRVDSGRSVHPFEDIVVEPADLRASEPRFCGKCLLKLRGWRVAGSGVGGPVAPAVVPEKSRAVPINGRMRFDRYQISEGDVTFDNNGADEIVNFSLEAKDPGNRKVVTGPFQFLHSHTFSWESSTGKLEDLTGILTREVVKWRRPTQAAPFNEYADPDQQFAQTGGGAQDGKGTDTHSMRSPSLICARNWGAPVGGSSLIAEQSYQYCLRNQYSLDDADWVDIPESQFRLEKAVYQLGKEWIMMFKKSNGPGNPVPFSFEIHYRIGPEFTFKPGLTANEFGGATQANPKRKGDPLVQQLVWAAGDRTLHIKRKNLTQRDVTLKELVSAGFAVRGTPAPKFS